MDFIIFPYGKIFVKLKLQLTMIEKENIREGGDLLSKDQIYKCQLNEKHEEVLFGRFWEAESGSVFEEITTKIKSCIKFKTFERAVVDLEKLKLKISEDNHFLDYEYTDSVGLSGLAFVYIFKSENLKITVTSKVDSRWCKIKCRIKENVEEIIISEEENDIDKLKIFLKGLKLEHSSNSS